MTNGHLMLNLGFGLSTFKTKRSAGKQAWLPPHIAFALEKPDTTKFDPQNPPDVVVTFNRPDVRELIPNLVNSNWCTFGEFQRMAGDLRANSTSSFRTICRCKCHR
jgi:hypothetical protein